jgi:hypothetical protein
MQIIKMQKNKKYKCRALKALMLSALPAVSIIYRCPALYLRNLKNGVCKMCITWEDHSKKPLTEFLEKNVRTEGWIIYGDFTLAPGSKAKIVSRTPHGFDLSVFISDSLSVVLRGVNPRFLRIIAEVEIVDEETAEAIEPDAENSPADMEPENMPPVG